MGARGPISNPNGVRATKKAEQGIVSEPKPRPLIPTCPKYLNAIARREWKRIVPELDRLQMLTCVDGAALEGYCNAYANMVEAQKILNENGMTFETEKGYVGQRPEVAIVNNSMKTIKSFCAEFGLTPNARARMALPGKTDDDDEMDKFLKGG